MVPENWYSEYSVLQVGGVGSIFGESLQGAGSATRYGNNVYLNSNGSWAYQVTDEASMYRQQDGAHEFYVAPSGTADAAISWNTGFEVLNDGKARAKNGLLFGTDTAAANTLDDYEEGTWTPSITRSGISIGSYAIRYGSYTKIGNQVTLFCKVQSSTVSGGSGTWKCTGLPFAPTGTNANTTVGRNYMDADTNDRDFRIAGNVADLMITSADNAYQANTGYVIWTFTSTFQVA